jgi:hypothetical protein
VKICEQIDNKRFTRILRRVMVVPVKIKACTPVSG